MAGNKRPSFLKRQKEQKRQARAVEKREARRARKENKTGVAGDSDIGNLEDLMYPQEDSVPEDEGEAEAER